jgi:hypothetical protein
MKEKAMQPIPDALKDRAIVSVKHAAKTAGVDQRTFLKRMADTSIPVIWLGPRKPSLMLVHFDQMLLALTKSAIPSGPKPQADQ